MSTDDRDPFIDAALRSLPQIEVPAHLMRSIAQIPIQHPQGLGWPVFSGVRNWLSWAACGALGVVCSSVLNLGVLTNSAAVDPMVSVAPSAENEWNRSLSANIGGSEQELLSSLFMESWTTPWALAQELTEESYQEEQP